MLRMTDTIAPPQVSRSVHGEDAKRFAHVGQSATDKSLVRLDDRLAAVEIVRGAEAAPILGISADHI